MSISKMKVADFQGNQDKKNKNGILELIGLESINNKFYRYYYEQIFEVKNDKINIPPWDKGSTSP